MAKRNPFLPLTKEEKEQRTKRKVEKLNLQKETADLASKCLNSGMFVRYREKYNQLERITIALLITYSEPDPIKYAFNVRRRLDELKNLRLLINQVLVDNLPKGGPKLEKEAT